MDIKRKVKINSSALEANLRETASEVDIPTRYYPLLNAAEPHYGLHLDLTVLLKEYFHPFRNDGIVLQNLARQVLGRWFNYQTNENREELFELFNELLWNLVTSTKAIEDKQEGIRVLFAFWGDSLASKYARCYVKSTLKYMNSLPNDDISIELLLSRDNQLASFGKSVALLPEVTPIFFRLYRDILLKGLQCAVESFDLATWAEDTPGAIEDVEKLRDVFAELHALRLEEYTAKLESEDIPLKQLLKFPNLSLLISRTLRALQRIPNPTDRFQAALFLLKNDVTGTRQKEVISVLLDVLGHLLDKGSDDELERIIYQVTSLLKKRSDFLPDVRFTIYERIGIAIGNASSQRLAAVFTDNLLSWPFEEPEIAGSTMDWKMKVNPFHLRNIVCIVHVVSSNPRLFQRLIAALTLFSRFSGVYIPDTALFQKEISTLLAADIAPVYHHIRQLCASLPVFFNELGAEGELRQFSTFLDQEHERNDSIIHFLRKAVHAETNNLLVDFSEEVLKYWHSGKYEDLLAFLPPELSHTPVDEANYRRKPGLILQKLTEKRSLDELLRLDKYALRKLVDCAEIEGVERIEAEKVFCLVRMVQLLREKYQVHSDHFNEDVISRFNLPQSMKDELLDSLKLGEDYPLLNSILTILEYLKKVITSPVKTQANENIYYKRHVAAGIPSMYGDYHEPKFDAMGLSFRLERFAIKIFSRIGKNINTQYLSKEFLWQAVKLLSRYQRALNIDGLLRDSFKVAVDLLKKCLESYRINYYQFRNILKLFLAAAVTGVVNGPIFGEYADAAARIFRNKLLSIVNQYDRSSAAVIEIGMRETLATTFGLQELDAFVGGICDIADRQSLTLNPELLSRVLNFREQRLITYLHDPNDLLSDPMHLGSKGYSLKRMANYNFNVPQGFIISTELFSINEALNEFPPLYHDIRRHIFKALDKLEEKTQRKLGDPENLLILSVRSSSASSMPGMMTTFLNVGLNLDIVESLSRQHNYGWTSWDCYRRFLQCWGMSCGISRDCFDNIISHYKSKFNVRYKLEFSDVTMKDIALSYRELLEKEGVEIPDDPREQVFETIRRVLASWDDEQARLYRREMDISNDWGTAVIVQKMVLGNINYDSGTGVVFTHPPDSRSLAVRLHGDYVFCSQGEDLVAGLVFPLPISEKQRRELKAFKGAAGSLETLLPEIYNSLHEVARELVTHHGFEHQEIEFTFESSDPEDLFILQSRPMVFDDEVANQVFRDHDTIWKFHVATGLGSGGGAFSGRIALTEEDIHRIKKGYPSDPILLVRPDTVPEDITLIVEAQGLLTARGGVTSHAAITAKKLGKTCVVNCRSMVVDDKNGKVTIGVKEYLSGEWLSINGNSGNIFEGHHPVEQ